MLVMAWVDAGLCSASTLSPARCAMTKTMLQAMILGADAISDSLTSPKALSLVSSA